MDLTRCASDLPYPEIEVQENIADSKLLMPSYGGAASEMTAILTYSFQSYISLKTPELKQTLEGVALNEMHHHKMLGTAIYKLGGYPVMGGRTYWNGSFVNYTLDPKKFLQQNIMAEETSILNYERTILNLKTESVKLLLERIILDEEQHIKIFKELLIAF
jgi:bacterioferritin